MKNYILKVSVIVFIVMFVISFARVAVAQNTPSKTVDVPQGKVFNLDAADRIKTSNTAVLDSKTFTVYQAKNGRLYFETGKLTKTGKAQRKYLTAAPKK